MGIPLNVTLQFSHTPNEHVMEEQIRKLERIARTSEMSWVCIIRQVASDLNRNIHLWQRMKWTERVRRNRIRNISEMGRKGEICHIKVQFFFLSSINCIGKFWIGMRFFFWCDVSTVHTQTCHFRSQQWVLCFKIRP